RRPPSTEAHSGAPTTVRPPTTMKPAIITNSPCAKFTASVALYTSTNPSAISEYMRPISTPLDSSSSENCQSSMHGVPPGAGRRRLDVLDLHARLGRRRASILVGDRRGQLDLAASRVEGVDDPRVLLGHVAPPHLARARHLGVVGVEVLGQQEEPPDPCGIRQRRVALVDLLADQLPHLGLLAEVGVARVRQPATLRPVADRGHVHG